jgi:hypothetical protein
MVDGGTKVPPYLSDGFFSSFCLYRLMVIHAGSEGRPYLRDGFFGGFCLYRLM